MGKPTESILNGDEIQSGCNSLLEVFPRASTYSPQKGFEFGESLFNRREIRRISRQKQEATPFGFDGLLHPASQVNREIIQDHDLSWLEAGSQDLLHVDLKSGSVSGTIQDERFSHALHRQGSNQRHHGSVIAWNFPYRSLSCGGIGIQRGSWQCESPSHPQRPNPHCSDLLLVCAKRHEPLHSARLLSASFFRVQPRATLARLILAGLTSMPYWALKSWQCSSRVASGWASNCALKWACKTAPFLAGRPGIAFGSI